MNSDLRIRRATAADLDAVLRIQTASPTAPQWTPGQLRDALQPGDSTDALKRQVFIAESSGEVMGFVAAVVVAITPAEAELESIAVLPQVRRRGVGRALLTAVIAFAHEHAAESLRLEVRADNAPAIAAYRAAGFRDAGLRRGYYPHPPEDALLMERLVPRKENATGPGRVA